MLNPKQTDLSEKILINIANVVSATLMFGSLINPKGFSLPLFGAGCILFVAFVGFAFWLRREEGE